MRNIYKIVLILLWLPLAGYAQSGKLFSADSELSNSLIYDIFQDNNGILWMATEDGLNRYDGSKFTAYKHNPTDSFSIGNNFVRILFEDSKGAFFVGLFKGLQLYDYATDTFRDIPMVSDNGETMKPHVTSIIERKNGDIFIGTSGQGIFILSQADGRIYAKQETRLIPSLFIIKLYEDKDGNLWVSTEDKGLYLLTTDKQVISFFSRNQRVLHNISDICEDTEGNLLVGSLSKGLFAFNRDSTTFFPIAYPENPNLPIKKLYKHGSDIYLCTDGYGVKIYNPQTKRIISSNFNVSLFDFDKSKVHTMLIDKTGNTWMGIYQKGVLLMPAQTNKFNYIGYKSVKRNSIGSNCIMSVYEDSEGILWVGTDNDGLYGIYPDGKQSVHFVHSESPHSVPATIICLYEDSNRELWVGSYLNGMGKVNKKTGECHYITGLLDENNNLVPRVYFFQEDADKHLWIGTMGAGLFRMDLKTEKVTNYNRIDTEKLSGDENVLYNNWLDCCLLSSDNKLYIGTYDGVVCLDLENMSYLSTFQSPSLLPGLVIYTLYEDGAGNIWAGTADGLMRIEKGTNRITAFTMEDGLPSHVICAIKGDKAGNLWISTHYGISVYNPQTQAFINYYASDGLQGNEFSKGAAIINSRGQFVFGGLNGITHFYPHEITHQERKPDIRITDFYIHDKPVRKGDKSGAYTIIGTSVMDAQAFHLSYKDNSFSIEFSTMEFANPERITYRYKVNNDNWVTLRPGINRVSFSNLSPGKYDFELQAKDYNSYSDIKNISVVISPPWYLTLWAKLAYVFIALFIIYLIIMYINQRYRSRQKMLQHQHAEEINEAKLQFFINIAHEIRTPMTLIISPLRRLMTSDKDAERQKGYKTIHRNAERILSLINQLMDMRKIDKGIMHLKFQEVEIIDFVRDIYTYFEFQAKTKDITFCLHTELQTLPVWIDPENFDKIILNVLSNAFKFTPKNGKIDICLNTIPEHARTNGSFEIVISDNGIGIKEEEKERIFERFYQIRNSYNNSNVSTGIGLHLTRSLVELHHGTIRMEDNEGGGSRFIIRIPLGKAHLTEKEFEDNPELLKKQTHLTNLLPETTDEEDTKKVKSKTKYKVMVVEDDEEIRKYITQELSEEYHIAEYKNGKEALDAVLKKAPDLIISDIMMPEMDGITLCRKIKQNININHVPIILLTARSKEEDNLEGLSIGADAYIVKPFNMEILKKTIENNIRNRELLRNTFKGNQHQEDKLRKISMKSPDEKLMERIMKVINENLSNPELSVEMIAEQVGISRVHLHRKLKELTNQTTRDFIRNIRLTQAAILLAEKNLPVSEVAEATGFTNLGYFSNAFKDLYGISPSAYNQRNSQ